jgi:hypothetical protein
VIRAEHVKAQAAPHVVAASAKLVRVQVLGVMIILSLVTVKHAALVAPISDVSSNVMLNMELQVSLRTSAVCSRRVRLYQNHRKVIAQRALIAMWTLVKKDACQ